MIAHRMVWVPRFAGSPPHFIGESLSEPHTSETALIAQMCVYTTLQPYIINFKWVHSNISWRLILCTKHGLLPCPSAVWVTWREVKACVAISGLCFYRPSTVGHSHRWYKYGQWLRSLQIEPVMHGMNDTQTLETVKLMNSSLSLVYAFVATLAALYWRNGWHMWYLATDLGWGISVLKFGYKLNDKSCYISWQISKPAINHTQLNVVLRS